MSRHNVFYVGACSFDNPLGGSYLVRTLTNKNLGRNLHCQKQEHLLNSSFYPSPFKRQVLKKLFPAASPITFQRVFIIVLIVQFFD